MQLLGIGLGVIIALLLGSADILATLATRRLRTFKTTFVSQLIGLLALLRLSNYRLLAMAPSFHIHRPCCPALLLASLQGCVLRSGYLLFYRALEVGPFLSSAQ